MINENLTELPKAWYLNINKETLSYINNYRKTHNYPIINDDSNLLLISYMTRGGSYDDIDGNYVKDGIEISLSQFKKWVLKEESKQDLSKTVVHCTTQEEWDYLLDNIEQSFYIQKTKGMYGINKCLCLTLNGSCSIEYAKEQNYTILSFSEWCTQFNHTPDFMKVKEENLVGRCLKYIGNSKNDPKYGDYFLIKSMDNKGLFRLRDKVEGCFWTPHAVLSNTDKSFELMPIGFEPFEEKVEENPKFIVGKWYFWTKHSNIPKGLKYIKAKSLNDDDIVYNERINVDNTFENSKHDNCTFDSELKLLTDLSEIQQYLPEGHPDKIKKEESIPEYVECIICNYYDDLIVGRIYKTKESILDKGYCAFNSTYFEQTFKPSTKELFLKQQESNKFDTLIKDELLAKAKRDYPIGTKIKSAYNNTILDITDDKFEWNEVSNWIQSNAVVYNQSNWAEIISKPEVKEEIFPFVKGKYYRYGNPDNIRYIQFDYINERFDKLYYLYRRDIYYQTELYNDYISYTKGEHTFVEVTEHEAKGIEMKKEVDKWTVGGWVRITKDCLSGTNKSTFKIGNIYQMSGYDSRTVWVITPTEEQASLYRDGECEWIGMEKPLEVFNDVDFGVHTHIYHPKTALCACGYNCMEEKEFPSLLPKPKETPIFISTRISTNQLLKTKLN